MTTHLTADPGLSVSIALLGVRSKDWQYIATLFSQDEVALWLSSHTDSEVDGERWRSVHVVSHMNGFETDRQRISAADWNRGVRWEHEVKAQVTFMGKDRPDELCGTFRSRRQLTRLFTDYKLFGDVRNWSAMHVSWQTPNMLKATEESVTMDAWLKGARWPLLDAWVQA